MSNANEWFLDLCLPPFRCTDTFKRMAQSHMECSRSANLISIWTSTFHHWQVQRHWEAIVRNTGRSRIYLYQGTCQVRAADSICEYCMSSNFAREHRRGVGIILKTVTDWFLSDKWPVGGLLHNWDISNRSIYRTRQSQDHLCQRLRGCRYRPICTSSS